MEFSCCGGERVMPYYWLNYIYLAVVIGMAIFGLALYLSKRKKEN